MTFADNGTVHFEMITLQRWGGGAVFAHHEGFNPEWWGTVNVSRLFALHICAGAA